MGPGAREPAGHGNACFLEVPSPWDEEGPGTVPSEQEESSAGDFQKADPKPPPLFRTSLCCYAIRWVLIAAMHKEKAHQEALSCSTWIPGPAHVC